MAFPSVYDKKTVEQILSRLDKLSPSTRPQWGKMNAAQMLAHLCVSYDMAYGKVNPKNNFLMRFLLKTFLKPMVVGDKPYPRNSRTAPVFVIADERDFAKEKARLTAYFQQVATDGAKKFEGLESPSFGKMTAAEWNALFYKHLDHHFTQFGI